MIWCLFPMLLLGSISSPVRFNWNQATRFWHRITSMGLVRISGYLWLKRPVQSFIRQPIPLLLANSPKEAADQLWQGVTPRTKVIFISHITSPTALRMPVELICQRAREAGILTVIDGAHAPGQIQVRFKPN